MLFQSLRLTGTKKRFAAMHRGVRESNLQRLREFGVDLVPNEPLDIPLLSSDQDMEERDQKLMSKLRVWELVQYSKVVQMDSDMVVLHNVDELFRMPEISATPMSDNDEKILFFERGGTRLTDFVRLDPNDNRALLPGWSGLNSGVVVLEPSLQTFAELMKELAAYPRRVCCPSQEFLYNFFERRNRYYRLPLVYNTRRIGNLGDARTSQLLTANAKVYHFVHQVKPWATPPENRTLDFVDAWWALSLQVDNALRRAGLGIVETEPDAIRRT